MKPALTLLLLLSLPALAQTKKNVVAITGLELIRELVASTPEELMRTMRADTEKWGRLVRERNIKIAQ